MCIIEIKHKSTNMMSNNNSLHQTYFSFLLTCRVAAQRSKSSIEQIDVEFKSETRSHCKIDLNLTNMHL